MGTVFRKDGKYLVCSDTVTHTGHHQTVEWVDDLNLATLLHWVPQWLMNSPEIEGAERLDAVEARVVKLISKIP
jgi:hypothetical protein